MSELIDLILADERLDASEISLNLTEVMLHGVLKEVCEDKRPLAGDHALILACDRQTSVKGDWTLLRIALSNLIDNALKYSPPKSSVEISVTCDGDNAVIRVSDRGPGISPEDQPHIFEKFYRSAKTSQVHGAGLGLFIVKRIVDLHDGNISIDSQPGAGATFTVELPLRSPSEH